MLMTVNGAEAARDPATSPEDLETLSKTHPALVAANPGAPVQLLARLIREHPDEVAANPAVQLGMITGDNILRYLGSGLMTSLIASRQADETLLGVIGDQLARPQEGFVASVARAFLSNPRTPAAVLVEIEKAVKTRKTKGILVGEVRRHRNYPQPSVPRHARSELERLLEEVKIPRYLSDDDLYSTLATTEMPGWAQVRLAKQNAWVFIESNYATDEVIDSLIYSDEPGNWVKLAAREDLTPSQYWNLLNEHMHHQPLQLALLRNKLLPPEVLWRLAVLLDDGVNLAALTHPNMTVQQLDRLASLERRLFPEAKLQEARRMARESGRAPLERGKPDHRWDNPNSAQQVAYLKREDRTELLVFIALSSRLHLVVARQLMNVWHPVVRLALALNPATPEAVLERMREDGDLLVAQAARR